MKISMFNFIGPFAVTILWSIEAFLTKNFIVATLGMPLLVVIGAWFWLSCWKGSVA